MTIFAGIVARRPSATFPPSAGKTLRQLVSRFPGEIVQEFVDDRSHLVKVDLNVYPSKGVIRDAHGRVSMVAGEPLLMGLDGRCADLREQDLSALHGAWRHEDWTLLSRCAGTFCAVHYDPVSCSLSLMADKMGVRPLYYWVGPDFVVFATALRILEGVAEVLDAMDLQGVTEMASFGYPLGDRTPYVNVKVLREAEVVRIGSSRVAKHQYWRWDRLPTSGDTQEQAAQLAFEKFGAAVKRRVKADRTVASFLSGGLDSRAIVATLRDLDVAVHTVNFSASNTQDYVFGAQIAAALGSMHQQISVDSERASDPYRKGGVTQWLNSKSVAHAPLEQPGLMWSGDGGSVGVGHVYLSQAVVGLMRSGKVDEAIDEYLVAEKIGIPEKIFSPRMADAIGGFLKNGIRAELERLHCDDPGRSFHLFLMFNDQRRHLAEHFENIDLDRIEFQLPFFDSDFLESILTLPLDTCLEHKFYMAWLARFAPIVTAVPWQAYPGHVPCPIASPGLLAYQWSRSKKSDARIKLRHSVVNYARQIRHAGQVPFALFNLPRLCAAGLLSYFGIRDYTYMFKVTSVFCRYWNVCGGRVSALQTAFKKTLVQGA